jgi:hypothetical protein
MVEAERVLARAPRSVSRGNLAEARNRKSHHFGAHFSRAFSGAFLCLLTLFQTNPGTTTILVNKLHAGRF